MAFHADYTILATTEVDMELIKRAKTPLPQLMLAIRDGLTILMIDDKKHVGVCVAEQRAEFFEILHLYVLPEYQKKGCGRELLLHTLDYIRFFGGQHVEIGVGNANVQMFMFLQRVGFRISGVAPDYYIHGHERPDVENSIVNRDMIRYHADLQLMMVRKNY